MVQSTLERTIKRIAFTLISPKRWTGGYNYLLNLFRALAIHGQESLRPVLFVGSDISPEECKPFQDLSNIELIGTPAVDAARSASGIARSLLSGVNSDMATLFDRYNVDVAFENAMFYGWKAPLPVISWLPDFQHRHLKHLFGNLAYWKREIGFQAQTRSHRLLMLSSEDARRDCELFYPASHRKTAVVRFSAPPGPPAETVVNGKELRELYELPDNFFYLPNQFWAHKNHRVVAEALGILKKRGVTKYVVASGNMHDHRNAHVYKELLQLIDSNGVQEQIRFIGLIPHNHVGDLMRLCDAVLNPSLFEGWSTTVEEARSAGTPMILSNLGVHMEQMETCAEYFDPHIPEELAEKLLNFKPLVSDERHEREKTAQVEMHVRFKRFAHDFVAAVDSAIKL